MWQRVDSRLVRRDGPTLFYWESGPREGGSLHLWLGPDGDVVAFQLSYTASGGGPEYSADWSLGGALRLGEIDSGETAVDGARHSKMSPIIRPTGQSRSSVLAHLLTYIEQNAAVLEASHRTTIIALLAAASEAIA